MRNLKRNKQTLYYALYKGREPKYKLDENGNKIVVYIDETTTPPTEYYEEDGTEDVYESTVAFKGNIAMSNSGDSQLVDFGVNLADYEAVLVTEKNLIPITETSLIWHNSEVILGDNGHPNPSSADYTVVKVKPSLNQSRYILSKVVK